MESEQNEDPRLLNIAMIVPQTTAAGPGNRLGIWVQGCSIGCPGCQSKDFGPHEARVLMSPKSLYEKVISIPDFVNIDGITISGGEPLEQSEALRLFLEYFSNTGKGIIIFSGYSWKKVTESKNLDIQTILNLIDCLICEPFYEKLKKFPNRLGSPNKKFIFLTERYSMKDFYDLQWEMDDLCAIYENKQENSTQNINDTLDDDISNPPSSNSTTEYFFDGKEILVSGRRNDDSLKPLFDRLSKKGINLKS